MKKITASLLTLAWLAFPRAALAEEVTLFSGVTTNTTSAVYDLSGSTQASVQISVTSGSPVAVFTWYCKNTINDAYTVAFTVPNPNGTPPYIGPGACYCYADLSGYASGTFTATLKRVTK